MKNRIKTFVINHKEEMFLGGAIGAIFVGTTVIASSVASRTTWNLLQEHPQKQPFYVWYDNETNQFASSYTDPQLS